MLHESLSTLQARTALSFIKKMLNFEGKEVTQKLIEQKAEFVIDSLFHDFPDKFDSTIIPALYAFCLSNIGKKAVREGNMTVVQYIGILANVKRDNYTSRKDYGAFGDLLEVLARLALVKNANLYNWRLLSVKTMYATDIVSKRFGKVEVGHNGKTLTFGTLYDYMDGDYTSVIYGVFDEWTKEQIYNDCIAGNIENALKTVCAYCGYWDNKYIFQSDMDNLTRGKGITVKGQDIQVVYNSGKYDAFVSALENGIIPCLANIR